MMIFSFALFLFLSLYYGLSFFIFCLSCYFLYEMFLGFDLGFLGSFFFSGGWGYILCLLSVIIIVLMCSGGVSLEISSSLYLYFLWFVYVSLMLCFSSNNFFLFYLSFEFVVLPIFLLMLFFGYSVDRLLASLYMFLYTLITSLPFLLFLLYNELIFHSLNFIYGELTESVGIFYCWWVLGMLLVFMVKYPIYIFHLWLPKAHVEAPVSGSMILAGVLLKLGAYGVLSLYIMSGVYISFMKSLLGSLSLLGVFLICLLSVRQLDIKMMVAYSSVVHMGPVFICFMYGFEFGLMGGNFMLLSHGLCSSALFYILNLGYERQYSRSLLLMRGGLVFSPVLSYWWFFLCMGNMGCPPLFNFISEIFVMWGIFYVSYFFIVFICLLGFFVGVYCIYMYEFFNHGIFLFNSGFYSVRHLENNVIFVHSFPILMSVLFLGELI